MCGVREGLMLRGVQVRGQGGGGGGEVGDVQGEREK
jgi:hypothetical protein